MKRTLVAVTLLLLASACGRPRSSEVFVGSASSFARAVVAARASYNEHDLEVLVAGSHTLATQVLDDAPIDVIVTADLRTIEPLVAAGKTAADPVLVARNQLVIAVARDNPLEILSLADLARPDVKVVLAGPEVPLGAYAAEVLESTGVDVRPVSLTDNATAVAAIVASGEADAGLVYRTDLPVWELTGIGLPEEVDIQTGYYVAPLTEAPNPTGARQFVDFLLSKDGRNLLSDLGFTV